MRPRENRRDQRDILAQTVKDLRAKTGLTQDGVAERCEFNREWLSSIEQGRVSEPSPEWLGQLAVVLGVHSAVLLKAAGYRVAEPPPVRPKTLSEALMEAAIIAKEVQKRAQDGDPKAIRELGEFAGMFARPLVLA